MANTIVATEPLTTRWGPDAPTHRTMLRQFVFNSAARVQHHAEAMGGSCHRTDDVCLADTHSSSAFGNQAILLRPMGERAAPGVIAQRREGFNSPHCMFSAWPPPDLRPYGYGLIGHPPFMVR